MNSREQAAPQALDVLEEAVHLLRLVPRRFFLLYYLGSAPFVLALLYFCTAMSHSAVAMEYGATATCGLACLFVWMQVWQAAFAAQVRAYRMGQAAVPWTLARWARVLIAHMAIAPWAWIVLPLSQVLLLPWARATAFFHNVTVLGDGTDASLQTLCAAAYQQATLWPRQNVVLLLILSLFRLCVFVNVGISMALLPFLLKTLLGIETVFSRHMEGLLNVTFVLTAWAITALCVGPLLKAVYVLRCFYGASLYSGADLQAALRELSLTRPSGSLLAGVLLLLACSVSAGAQGATAPSTTDVTPQLDRAITEVLQQREYVWRLPRSREASLAAAGSGSLFPSFYNTLKTWLHTVGTWFERLSDWWRRLFPQPRLPELPQTPGTPLVSALVWLTGMAVTVLLLALGWRLRQRRRRVETAPIMATVVPSLADERLTADVLPAQEWASLAHDLWQQGDWRLAMRAWHLATLAYLAQRQLLSISVAKSNREYAQELDRRAHTQPQLLAAFAHSVSMFERVWYGTHSANGELCQQLHHIYERIQACADA